jgi:hypothetical protein
MIHQWQTKHNLTNQAAADALGCHISLIDQLRSGKGKKITRRTQLLMDAYDREHKSPFMSAT